MMRKRARKRTKHIFALIISIIILSIIFISAARMEKPENILLSFDTEEVAGEKTLALLDVLEENDVSATFFVTGKYAEEYPEIVERISEGNEVACHSYSHKNMRKISKTEKENEIITCKRLLENITGREVIGFRAPYNSIDKETYDILKKQGFEYDATQIAGYHFFQKPTINEIRISSFMMIPLSDYFWVYLFHADKAYFFFLKHMNRKTVSILFHSHLSDSYLDEIDDFIKDSKEKNISFKTHKDFLYSK